MKLSDFNTKVPVHKKSSLVFNLNNEKRELAASIQIKALETELASLKNELLQLRPLPDKISILEERLNNKEQSILKLEKTHKQDKILLDRAEEKVSHASKQEKEFKHLQEVEKFLRNKKIDIERELKNAFDEIRKIKNEYNDLSQALTTRSSERNKLKSEFETLTNSNSTLQNDYFKLKSLYTKSSKINVEDKKVLGKLRTEIDYLETDNNAAREKISMLENIKHKVESWANTLTRTNTESSSKVAAFEQTVQNSKEVLLNMSKQIDSLMEDRQELVEIIKLYQLELKKPRYFSADKQMRTAGMPSKQNIVHRQYVGLGVPTMLKFKSSEEGN